MKKNQIVFVVILTILIFVFTFLMTIFALFRIETVEIQCNLYEKKLIESGIEESLKSHLQSNLQGRSSLFVDRKEVEKFVNSYADNNKNYLMIESVNRISPKSVRITFSQKQIDNYCYQENNKYYHFNTNGEILQITNSAENQLLSKETTINNLVIPETVVKLSTRVQVGQAISGESTEENEKWNSLKLILQSLDIYFAQEKQYRTCQYVTTLVGETQADVAIPNLNDWIRLVFTVENDFHYLSDGNYTIDLSFLHKNIQKAVEKMNEGLARQKDPANKFLIVTALEIPTVSWSNSAVGSKMF